MSRHDRPREALVQIHPELARDARRTWPAPGWRDLAATLIVASCLLLAGIWASRVGGPLSLGPERTLSLSPGALPGYTLRSVARMLAALLASFVFTLGYASLAARSRRAGAVLIPLLDVLQSVPILGYLSLTVLFFLSLFPGRVLGAECAAVFAIFTSQAWNMTFSFYQALCTVPRDLDEAARGFRLSGWQRFWRVEVPFALPGLVWNAMMSMSGGWFFVVASEAIAVGGLRVELPGVGAYVALAIERRDLAAVGWAVAAMSVAIVSCDQLLFRPLMAWSERFRYGDAEPASAPRSWVLEVFRRSAWAACAARPLAGLLRRAARARLRPPQWRWPERFKLPAGALARLGMLPGGAALAWLGFALYRAGRPALAWADLYAVTCAGALTTLRVGVLVMLASLVWVPLGIAIGLRPKLAARIQPVSQFLAAFPANLLFPVAVVAILRLHLRVDIWLALLMMLGAQWYILFNVIAGASAFPADLREAADSLRLSTRTWWRRVMLPGVFPYYLTGAITASGGAWNASVVGEALNWGDTRLDAGGLGAYIARATAAGDYPRIALGVAFMSMLVVAISRLVWRPMYAFAQRRTRLD
ncbi:ABC transporter permease subunit [Burkholderia gladioli]|nr:ABC transporter permease subunit [Burkholderia gladioli]MBU9168465.1 ABC transporter permease subunit [Burkholderia gladioli]